MPLCSSCNGSSRDPITGGTCSTCHGVGLSPASYPTADNAAMVLAFDCAIRFVEMVGCLPQAQAILLASRLHEYANVASVNEGEAVKNIYRAMACFAEDANPANMRGRKR